MAGKSSRGLASYWVSID